MTCFLKSWTGKGLKLISYEYVSTIAMIIYTHDFFIKNDYKYV